MKCNIYTIKQYYSVCCCLCGGVFTWRVLIGLVRIGFSEIEQGFFNLLIN